MELGLKTWLARRTSSPATFAVAYSSGITELSAHFAAVLVAFSGHKKAYSSKQEARPFEDHFDMEQSGYVPLTKDIADLTGGIDPDINPKLFSRAFLIVSAFAILHSQSCAYRHMREDNAHSFSVALVPAMLKQIAPYVSGSTRTGLEGELREVLSHLSCTKLLNKESFGRGDCLGKILEQLSVSEDRSAAYAFVVGSPEQPLGCAKEYVELVQAVDDSIRRCADEIRW
jgi:hypothetical protein